jgi:hypothetical protein
MNEVNNPVLVGSVPLLYVQSMKVAEGYRIEPIAGSAFFQALAPTRMKITIEAVLLGPNRLVLKKELEALALVSRVLVAAETPGFPGAGVSVVSGLTISLDMQITDLRFTVSAKRREAVDVSISLEQVSRSSLVAILGAVADLALAAGTAIPATPPSPASLPRVPSLSL